MDTYSEKYNLLRDHSAENLIWLLLRRLQQTVFDFGLSGKESSSSATEDQSNGVYVDIHALPFSPPPAPDVAAQSQTNSLHEHDVNMVKYDISTRNNRMSADLK